MTQSDKLDSQLQQFLATSSPEVDFALASSRTIDSMRHNPAQLRDTVYELARVKLREQSAQASEQEVKRLSRALELAINRVEAFSLKEDPRSISPPPAFLLEDRGKITPPPAVEARAEETPAEETKEAAPLFPSLERRRSQPAKKPRARFVPLHPRFVASAVILAAVFGALVYLQPKLRSAEQIFSSSAASPTAAATTTPVSRPATPVVAPSGNSKEAAGARAFLGEVMRPAGTPLPAHYGVFAVSDGQLYEIEPLQVRAPDQRINISAMFSTESRTVVPNGRVQFVVFRRDFNTNLPDRISARVIAEIRVLAFDPWGRPVQNNDKYWAIRNVAYDFRVTPVPENPELLIVRPDNPAYTLSPGRYALVLRGGQAYDFTVAGTITEASQCLEQVKADNGMSYSECRKKQ